MFNRKKLSLLCLLLLITVCALSFPVGVYVLTTNPDSGLSLQAWWHGAVYQGEGGVIRQQTKYDCGVVCLQMVLRERGIAARVEELRLRAQTTHQGTSLLGLKWAAERYGVKASAWRLNQSDLLRIPLPVIAFIDGNHFVVISSVNIDGTLTVLDPARGRLLYTSASFYRHWKGEALILGELPDQTIDEKPTSDK